MKFHSQTLKLQQVFLMIPTFQKVVRNTTKKMLKIFFTDNADIPQDPEVALRDNAMKVTRLNAVAQVKLMVDLVDDIASNALKTMVSGEILETKSPLGVSMIIAK